MMPQGTAAATATATPLTSAVGGRQRALHESVSFGDSGVVRALLEAGADVDHQDESGRTPLIVAAERGDIATMTVLVEAGADIDGRDGAKRGWPPLMYALFAGCVDAVEALLDWGADPNAAEDSGFDALMMAASRGDVAVVSQLLDCGADPTRELFLGYTAVDYAIGYGHADVVRLLLEAAPELKQRGNAARRSVIALARNGGDEDVLQLLA